MNLHELRHRASLAFSRHLRTLRPASFARYAWWRLRGNRRDILVALRDGTRLMVRGGKEDYWILSEIFFDRQYEPPTPVPFAQMRTIVDVGANVGYSCVWFARNAPQARILAFEPLPAHVHQVHINLGLNGLDDRVTVLGVAAATRAEPLILQPAGAQTAVVERASADSMSVPAVDWFARLPEAEIDLVKLDIEGAERPLLADPRFGELAARVRYIVVEWHDPDAGDQAKRACRQRLTDVGFEVWEGADYGVAGLLWGIGPREHGP